MLIVVAMLAFSVRVGDFFGDLHNMGAASAQEEVKAEPPPLPAAGAGDAKVPPLPARPDMSEAAAKAEEDAKKPQTVDHPPPVPAMPGAEYAAGEGGGLPVPPAIDEKTAKAVDWKDAADADLAGSDSQIQLFKDLAKRRDQLDAREKAIAQREALLKAGEHELDQKVNELTALKGEIQSLLQTQSEEEKARLGSLVKIYEGMKPKDAARIFNTLDLDVLIRVMGAMSERKTSPILAEMDDERARTVTTMLAQQKQLPAVPAE
jgi:flagellar motility protein MotE (MotC chaperone)